MELLIKAASKLEFLMMAVGGDIFRLGPALVQTKKATGGRSDLLRFSQEKL